MKRKKEFFFLFMVIVWCEVGVNCMMLFWDWWELDGFIDGVVFGVELLVKVVN